MPKELIKRARRRIALTSDNLLMFVKRDGSLLFVPHQRPLLFWQHGPGQPMHSSGVVVGAAEKNIGGNRTPFENIQQMFGGRLHQFQVPNTVKRLRSEEHTSELQ